ncbi:MAG: hypothetical protein Q7T55_04665 [Solirubrobacteraceae bacterium]|nr:hypothetical protein [Solirubrobacteraceae bacterium]
MSATTKRIDAATEALVRRATADLAADRPWLAMDRLQNALVADPSRDEVRALLGETYLRMQDERRAGRVLASTERSDDDASRAIAVWVASLGDQRRLTRRAVRDVISTGVMDDDRLESLGPVARARLDPIVVATRAEVERLASVGKRIDGLTELDGTITFSPPPPPQPDIFETTRGKIGLWIAGAVMSAGAFQVGGWIGLW